MADIQQSGADEHVICEAKPEAQIPVRDAVTAPGMVDLTAFYNTALDDCVHGKPGNTLSSLPKGIQVFGGALFDVRGLIQLVGSHSEKTTGIIYPAAVTGIAVGGMGRRLHFLHAAAWSVATGTPIGVYVVHYTDGRLASIPIRYGLNVSDWWIWPESEPPSEVEVAWEGSNERTAGMGFNIRLFKYTWQNPLPDVAITSLDFVSTIADSAPMLLAITLD